MRPPVQNNCSSSAPYSPDVDGDKRVQKTVINVDTNSPACSKVTATHLWIFLSFCLLSSWLCYSLGKGDFQKLQTYTTKHYDQQTLARIHQWITLVTTIKQGEKIDKLHAANDFFNVNVRFTSDLNIWGKEDYWATPLQTLNKQQGDCEDFTIAKYVTLLLAGVPEEELRLIYVQAQIGPDPKRDVQAHMVLAYYATPGGEPLIIDNLVPQIMPAAKRTDLTPVFSFNAASLWVAGQGTAYNSQSRLSKWQDVLTRIRQEGFFND